MKIGGKKPSAAAAAEIGGRELYAALAAELGTLDFSARLELANALNDGTLFDDLPEDQQRVFVEAWRAIP